MLCVEWLVIIEKHPCEVVVFSLFLSVAVSFFVIHKSSLRAVNLWDAPKKKKKKKNGRIQCNGNELLEVWLGRSEVREWKFKKPFWTITGKNVVKPLPLRVNFKWNDFWKSSWRPECCFLGSYGPQRGHGLNLFFFLRINGPEVDFPFHDRN